MTKEQIVETSANNKRIAKNTIFLYFRMVVILIVSLYTSRIVLETLGIQDFGIYNVVGGITAMFAVFSGSLTDATQRFITYEIGKGNKGVPNKIFSISVLLHIVIGILIVLMMEPIGLWFLHNKLLIPPERMEAATWVFHFTVISMFIMIYSIPYNALIIAYEKMKAFAFISIIDAFLRLGIVFILFLDLCIDKLILYGILMMLTQVILRLVYTFYCHRYIDNSHYFHSWDPKIMKEIGIFASWTLFGNGAYVCYTQGLNLLLGTFFMPFVNAARGIAVQAQSATNMLVRNFQIAVNPQITKNFANGNLKQLHELLFTSSRASFYLLLLPLLPVCFECNKILLIWLKEVPQYTATFVIILLVSSLLTTLSNPLEVSAKASGKIKHFECAVYGLKLLILPVSYCYLYMGYSPVSVFIINLIFEIIAFIVAVFISKKLISYNMREYCMKVIIPIVITTLFSLIVPTFIYISMNTTVLRLCVNVCVTPMWTLFCVYIFGINNKEKQFINSKLKKYKK